FDSGVAKPQESVVSYADRSVMSRVDRLRGWVKAQIDRLPPAMVPAGARLRARAAAAGPLVRQTASGVKARLKPVAAAAGPQLRQAAPSGQARPPPGAGGGPAAGQGGGPVA